MYLFFKRANRLVVLLAVLAAIAALVGVAGPRVASADGAASEALLHKVYLGWIGGSIITPGPGEEAGGPLSFDDQNVAHLTVINEVKQTSVSATATQPGATIHVDRADEQPQRFREGYPLTVDFGLRVGRNTVTITVTSADGAAETAYVINITRKQPNGRLRIDRHDGTRSFRIPTPGVSGPVKEVLLLPVEPDCSIGRSHQPRPILGGVEAGEALEHRADHGERLQRVAGGL